MLRASCGKVDPVFRMNDALIKREASDGSQKCRSTFGSDALAGHLDALPRPCRRHRVGDGMEDSQKTEFAWRLPSPKLQPGRGSNSLAALKRSHLFGSCPMLSSLRRASFKQKAPISYEEENTRHVCCASLRVLHGDAKVFSEGPAPSICRPTATTLHHPNLRTDD